MKTKTILLALMAVVLSVGFSACGDDEIAPSNGGNTGNGEPSPQEQVATTSVTGGVYDISATSASFTGYVNLTPTELTTATFGIIWGAVEDLKWDNKAGYATSRELETNKYSVTTHDLKPENKYFYRSYVCLNGNTYVYGAVKSFTTAQHAAQTPYVLWCNSNTTLYFVCSDSFLEVGNTHNSQTITALWYGDDIVAQSTDNPAWTSIRSSIKHVVFEESFKEIKPKSLKSWFSSAKNLSSIDGLEYLNTSEATDMRGMFMDCSSLTSLNISHFDTQNVKNMSSMFGGCSKLTSLDVSHFDTQNVTSMQCIFYDCSSLTSLDVSHFDTKNVTDMRSMFWGCNSLTSLDVSHFDTKNVTKMRYMFDFCRKLTSLDVSHFDTQNVTGMSGMFRNCRSLTSLDVSHFNTQNVTDMGQMFSECSNLTSLDVSHFNTQNVTDMWQMFSECRSLMSLDVSHFDTQNVTDMSYMFSGCGGLTSLDVSHFDTQNVENMSSMFYGCSKLTTLYCNDTWSCQNSGLMFGSCVNLVGAIAYDAYKTDATYANPDTGYFTRK